ncbi:hypothetical protein MJT46_007831 [Ovis ammon polii x Ovis aries]|nr:hypothetical protein MJT46_007831 [Ovis ammon polii x Ovis aries]
MERMGRPWRRPCKLVIKLTTALLEVLMMDPTEATRATSLLIAWIPKAHWTKIILKIAKDNISEWEARFLRKVRCNVFLSFLRFIMSEFSSVISVSLPIHEPQCFTPYTTFPKKGVVYGMDSEKNESSFSRALQASAITEELLPGEAKSRHLQLNTSECLANLISEEAAVTVTSDTGTLTGVNIPL